jgi:hypothetical protein
MNAIATQLETCGIAPLVLQTVKGQPELIAGTVDDPIELHGFATEDALFARVEQMGVRVNRTSVKTLRADHRPEGPWLLQIRVGVSLDTSKPPEQIAETQTGAVKPPQPPGPPSGFYVGLPSGPWMRWLPEACRY